LFLDKNRILVFEISLNIYYQKKKKKEIQQIKNRPKGRFLQLLNFLRIAAKPARKG